jgi:2,3-dihydro-2,3-dihydroxybenzoate dehydrogenase
MRAPDHCEDTVNTSFFPSDGRRRVAVVTGAAGGIGTAIARTLAGHGVTVAAFDVHHAARPEPAGGDGGTPGNIHPFVVDVSRREDVDSAVDAVESGLGPIDYLVNAAGILRVGPAATLTGEDWRHTFNVNATGVFNVSQAVAHRMIPRRGGVIVTVASNSAATARWHMAAYAASKAAASSFTKTLGLELGRYGIRCNVVAPGSTDTPMLTSLWSGSDALQASIDGTPQLFRGGIPLGRIASPQNIADAVLFLLSDRAAHITMHDLTVDGGATLGH